jgi:hypothetical protein
LHREIVDERQTLRAVMSTLGIDASPLTPAGAWLLEKAGRLKLNGQVRGHSPLSPLVELEGLEAGVSGKRSLWQVLGRAFPADARLERFHLDELVARADTSSSRAFKSTGSLLRPMHCANTLREEHTPRTTGLLRGPEGRLRISRIGGLSNVFWGTWPLPNNLIRPAICGHAFYVGCDVTASNNE